MKKREGKMEVETKINILQKNIKSLKKRMTDKEKERKYRYHLKGLEKAKERLLLKAQMPSFPSK